ncbi:MAG TPA: nucleotidyltransferase domain-containing protein [Candidatus Methylacidiphilales bacterium]|jgi:predicted nucleotidyltransferase|nr:nucleotidyltransferase domain-containing protein [Candidatus Methylacidiphilales bacterium]
MKSLPPSTVTLTRLKPELENFCRNRPIARLEVFGSVARGEESTGSDLDLLVTFAPGTPRGMAHFAFVDDLEKELERLLGCEVDLIEREALEQNPNPMWRKLIFSDARELYAAG